MSAPSKSPALHKHSPGLDALRQKVDAADRQLVGLLARRQRIVNQIIKAKRRGNLPAFHQDRQNDIIAARGTQAREAGLDPEIIEDVFRVIFRHSRVSQLRKLASRSARPGARVLIVGGRGQMGKFFAHWFRQSGYVVRVLDRNDWANARQLATQIGLCLLSVPIHVTSDATRQIAPFLPPDCVLADIASLKREPMEAMLSGHTGPVVGLHPLFGPDVASMDKQVVVWSPGRRADECEWLLKQLEIWGNAIMQAVPEEHDEIMGIVQALRHFATFAFGQFLQRRNVSISRALAMSSPIYRLELLMVGRLFAQDPVLYADILLATPKRLALLKDYVESLKENLMFIEPCDKGEFINRFRKLAEWFGPFTEDSMKESSLLIEDMVRRS
jgi:chorismate mutase / prephenate dehydrogenase